ncbi:MAG: hypothetical protein KUG80_00780 [Gammaproteobacteria bacterium]|nr:hypothetical protein [Gammaproteobacteria bacterium]
MSNNKDTAKDSEDILIALDQVEQTIEVMCDTVVRLKEHVTRKLSVLDDHDILVAQNSLENSVAPKTIMH